ncbi:MAG: biotin transporter BioY [Palaeococcus sp.]|uniref:biotin transporter BioY n=1 Tax=Palaeococcus sp. (in: euryarchaeotes) TaxID=2820298 RepID=UPI0025F2AB6F|nr:biotin transporter BioY [Palaeococcus sp. (in: euryarchaeotes)]MCD6559927.1 biotin transporter BioY [Palaeococcus sp. (in: euryarchaeotes)]
MKAREITLTALFAALTAIGAQISIPLGEVPITLQVLFVLLSGLILGARLGFMSQAIYVLMGALGLPVFAGFKGGLPIIYGPTGGYIIAFPLAALIAGFIATEKENVYGYAIASLSGVLIIYLLGWLRLGFFLGRDFEKAFILGIAPFILVDSLKGVVAVLIADRVRKAVRFSV